MTPDQAINAMRSPRDMAIICIDVTNRCDLQCSNCTRLLAQQRRKWDMTPDNWRLALRSLAGFDGVIAMIGGNPCIHPQFPELCRIFVEEIPEQRQRGLWSNNVFRHQDIIAATFGCYNLNPHGDKRGVKSLLELRKRLPNLPFYEGSSYHAPLMTAIKDLIPDEGKMWDAIAGCDINANWSASIVQNQGNLRAYFCEVAASFDLARGEDHGHPVTVGWWRQHISEFASQVRHFCPGCGAAARLAGRLDSEDTDDYTASNAGIANNTRGKRKVVELTEAVKSTTAVTDYSDEHHLRATIKDAGKISLSVIIPAYNAANTIRETIESVASQPFPDTIVVEVLVADDGSTDDTRKLVELMALVEKRVHIRLLPAAKNAGPGAARNRGLAASSSDYVMFLDSDDLLAEGMVWVCLQTLSEHPELAAVITDVELLNAHRDVLPAQLNAMIWSMPSNMVVRRSIADLLDGFPEDAAYRGPHATEDMVFKQALAAFFRIGWIRYPFLKYRVHPGSHFDVFLDTTYVVNGELQYVNKETNDALDAATAIYLTRAKMRVDEIGASREDGEAHVVLIDISRREHA